MPRTHQAHVYSDGSLYGWINHTQYYTLPYTFTAKYIRGLYNTLEHALQTSLIMPSGDLGTGAVSGTSGSMTVQQGGGANQQNYPRFNNLPWASSATVANTVSWGSQFQGNAVRGGGYLLVHKCVDRYTFINHSNVAERVEFFFVSPKDWRDGDYSYITSQYNAAANVTGTVQGTYQDCPTIFNYLGLAEQYAQAGASKQDDTVPPAVSGGAVTFAAAGTVNVDGSQAIDPGTQVFKNTAVVATAKVTPFSAVRYNKDYTTAAVDPLALQTPPNIPFGKSPLFRRHYKVYACKRFVIAAGKTVTISVKWKKPFKWPLQKLMSNAEYGADKSVLGPKQKMLVVGMTGMTYPDSADETKTGLGPTCLNYTKQTYISYSHEPDNNFRAFAVSNPFSMTALPSVPAKGVMQTVVGGNEVPAEN